MVAQEWLGLPAGVKFDPSDQELLGHLESKLGVGNVKPHPLIDEFIPTLDKDDGICYVHPEKLPGVKQDGSIVHFFHRTAKAYTTGTRKRRKIHCEGDQSGGDVRWHKTGKTRPVNENGIQKGWKKIMVLYMSTGKGEKPEKTNWVMHQYHLGIEEDEKDREFVVSKVFYQQQCKQLDKHEDEVPQETGEALIPKGDPVTPKTNTPELPRPGKRHADLDTIQEEQLDSINNLGQVVAVDAASHQPVGNYEPEWEGPNDHANANFDDFHMASQFRDDSGQLVDGLFFCDEKLQSSSSKENSGTEKLIPGLSEYGRIGVEELEENRDGYEASAALANIELDTPPDLNAIELQFSSQESVSAWVRDNPDWT
eukprot:Gb_13200 [translate_table: standard]